MRCVDYGTRGRGWVGYPTWSPLVLTLFFSSRVRIFEFNVQRRTHTRTPANPHTQHIRSSIAHTHGEWWKRKREGEGKEEPGKQSAERVPSCVLALLFIYLFVFLLVGEAVSREQAKRNGARRNEARSQIQRLPRSPCTQSHQTTDRICTAQV